MAGLLDFAATAGAIPEFASAWGEIAAQLDVEGAGNAQVEGTKVAFVNAFESLSSQAQGLVGAENIDAAKNFVLVGQTVAGAVHMAIGLVDAIQTEAPPEVLNAFTGTMIGLAVSSGAVSAGVGAAIVGAVAVVLNVLQSAGLFSSATEKADFEIGPDIGGIAMNTFGTARDLNMAQVAPGAPGWRTFPRPDVKADALWFDMSANRLKSLYPGIWGCGLPGTPLWKGLRFGGKPNGKRSIDQAYPSYALVARDAGIESAQSVESARAMAAAGAPGLLWPRSSFQRSFASACMLNWEYALNALKPRTDEQVLIHVLRVWNRAHEGPVVPMAPAQTTYAQSIVEGAIHALGGDRSLTTADGRALLLNVGAQKGLPPLPAGEAAGRHTVALRVGPQPPAAAVAAAAAAYQYRAAGEAAQARKTTRYLGEARAAALIARASARPVTLSSLGAAVHRPAQGHAWWFLGIAAALAALWARGATKGK